MGPPRPKHACSGWESFQHGGPPPRGSVGPHGWNFTNLTAYYHSLGLKLGMYVTGGFEAVYEHEAEWAEVSTMTSCVCKRARFTNTPQHPTS